MACIFASLLCFPSLCLNIALERQCEGANFKANYSVHRETDQLPGMKSESEVRQSCPTLCDPVDCSPPGSCAHGILQARILEWVAIFFSRGSSWPRDWTHVSCIADGSFTPEPPGSPWCVQRKYLLIFYGCIFFAVWGLSLVAENGGYSGFLTGASHCSDLSCCGARALGCVGFGSYGVWGLELGFSSCGTQA